MAKRQAPLAGEMSGHIFYADGFYGHDDALYVAVRLLGILAQGERTLADWRDRMAPLVNTPEIRFDCPDEQKFAVIDRVKARLESRGGRGQRHRRRAGDHRGRLVAAARLQHPGGAGRARRGERRGGPRPAQAPDRLEPPRGGHRAARVLDAAPAAPGGRTSWCLFIGRPLESGRGISRRAGRTPPGCPATPSALPPRWPSWSAISAAPGSRS